MAYRARWLVPYRVMESTLSGPVTMADMDRHTEAAVQFLTEAQTHAPGQMVYNLFNTLEADRAIPAYLMLTKALPVLRFKNRGPLYHVTKSAQQRNVGDLTAHLMSFAIRTFEDYDEALEAIDNALAHEDFHLSSK